MVSGAGNPQALNRYAYAVNNPLRYTDPSGHMIDWDGGGGGYSRWHLPPDWLDHASTGLAVRLQFTSDNLICSLNCVVGYCEERGYLPSDSFAQAMEIVRDWFLEAGDEVQYFGPEDPLTQDLMYDPGVEWFREEWAAAGYPLPWSHEYSIDEAGGTGGIVRVFVRENLELAITFVGLGSMTPEGQVDAVGGVLGSYEVSVSGEGFGMVKIVIYNETGWASGTRVPRTKWSLIQDRPRNAWGPGGTIKQYFYWLEPYPVGP